MPRRFRRNMPQHLHDQRGSGTTTIVDDMIKFAYDVRNDEQ